MLEEKELGRALLDSFGINPEKVAEKLIEELSAQLDACDGGPLGLYEAVEEAGRELLPPGVSDQLWSGFVFGYSTGTNMKDEEDE